jgi:hypothetical protein
MKIPTLAPLLLAALALGGCATRLPDAAQPAPDGIYGAPEAWLCRPGRADLCAQPQKVSVIAADGSRSVRTVAPRADAPIDCFYVYPTISEAPTGNSPLAAGPGENRAVAMQFAPFASVCRPFAPVYRQVTLAGLASVVRGQGVPVDPQIGLSDVREAWRHYLAHDNHGRGVVLVGHSQGTRMLTELIKQDIEGRPVQKRIVSALLIGLNVEVPAGADVGGTFRHMPLCRRGDQTGCVVAYSTFRASSPPPDNARFGHSTKPGVDIACVDVMQLTGLPVQAMMPTRMNLLGRPDHAAAWMQAMQPIPTLFVDMPGLFKAECVKQGANAYLALSVDAAARGVRTDAIPGNVAYGGRVLPDWGLHLVDINMFMGNLLALVQRQGAAYR